MGEEKQYLSRTQNNRRRKVKEKKNSTITNQLFNFLITIVSLLIIVSLILIFTDSNMKSIFKKSNEISSVAIENEANENNQTESNTLENEVDSEVQGAEQQQSDQSESQIEEQDNITSSPDTNMESQIDSSIDEQLQYITTVPSEDPNVIIAWEDVRWTPYPTEQTGEHYNAFDLEHIDYQEKVKLIYRETGFTEDTSILWNIKNDSGNAIAVISGKNRTNIFRLTLKWVNNQGWQVILVEQLADLQGAY